MALQMSSSNVSFRELHRMLTYQYPFSGDEPVQVQQVISFLTEVHEKVADMPLSEDTQEMVATLPNWIAGYEAVPQQNAMVPKSDLVSQLKFLGQVGHQLWREHAANQELYRENHEFKHGPLEQAAPEVTGGLEPANRFDEKAKAKIERATSKRNEAIARAAVHDAVPLGKIAKGKRVFKAERKWR